MAAPPFWMRSMNYQQLNHCSLLTACSACSCSLATSSQSAQPAKQQSLPPCTSSSATTASCTLRGANAILVLPRRLRVWWNLLVMCNFPKKTYNHMHSICSNTPPKRHGYARKKQKKAENIGFISIYRLFSYQ